MADRVLDSSAVLASARKEPGGDIASATFGTSLVSAVNLTEVVSRLVDVGLSFDAARHVVDSAGFSIVGFDEGLALRAGALRAATRHLGLSLGDRACLALAQREGLPVLTADRAWASLDIGVEIRLIR